MNEEETTERAPLPETAHLTGWEDVVFELEDDAEESPWAD